MIIRSIPTNVRLEESDYELVQKAAKRYGMRVAAYLRAAGLEKARRDTEKQDRAA